MSRYTKIALEGASVAITGGAQGIGRATAEEFIARGARVSIGDLDLDLARQTAAAIGATAHHLDVADPESYRAFLAATAEEHGNLDVLVNNAGIMPNGGFLDLDDRMNQLMMDVNVWGVVNGMRLALPAMVERRRGHVVNVASLAGKFPIPGLAMYNATKFAVVGLTAATRREYVKSGVSITAVLPSAVDTALASGLAMKPIPKVKPEQIAAAVVGSVANRKGEIAVPGYVGGLAGIAAMTPEPIMNGIRRLVRDDRALRPASDERSDYRARLDAAAGTGTSSASR